MSNVLSIIFYVFIALLVLMVMITVHELGHYLVGKLFGFTIQEFSIGFGPAIYKKTKADGEIFSVRLFPLGGYCAFSGEDESVKDKNAFSNKPPWQRILVLIAGPFMNYLLALFVIIISFSVYGQTAYLTNNVVINDAYEGYSFIGSNASGYTGDIIYKIEGKNVYLLSDVMQGLNGKQKDETVNFTVIRNGEYKTVPIKLREDANFINLEDYGTLYSALGLSKENNGLLTTEIRLGFFDIILRSFDYSVKLTGTLFAVLGQLITGKLGVNAVGGTFTTISLTAKAIKNGGLKYLFSVSSLIGVNLAVFNLLPIPALDGSRVLFCLFEWIFRKPVNKKAERIIHFVGLILLLGMALFFDIQHVFV